MMPPRQRRIGPRVAGRQFLYCLRRPGLRWASGSLTRSAVVAADASAAEADFSSAGLADCVAVGLGVPADAFEVAAAVLATTLGACS